MNLGGNPPDANADGDSDWEKQCRDAMRREQPQPGPARAPDDIWQPASATNDSPLSDTVPDVAGPPPPVPGHPTDVLRGSAPALAPDAAGPAPTDATSGTEAPSGMCDPDAPGEPEYAQMPPHDPHAPPSARPVPRPGLDILALAFQAIQVARKLDPALGHLFEPAKKRLLEFLQSAGWKLDKGQDRARVIEIRGLPAASVEMSYAAWLNERGEVAVPALDLRRVRTLSLLSEFRPAAAADAVHDSVLREGLKVVAAQIDADLCRALEDPAAEEPARTRLARLRDFRKRLAAMPERLWTLCDDSQDTPCPIIAAQESDVRIDETLPGLVATSIRAIVLPAVRFVEAPDAVPLGVRAWLAVTAIDVPNIEGMRDLTDRLAMTWRDEIAAGAAGWDRALAARRRWIIDALDGRADALRSLLDAGLLRPSYVESWEGLWTECARLAPECGLSLPDTSAWTPPRGSEPLVEASPADPAAPVRHEWHFAAEAPPDHGFVMRVGFGEGGSARVIDRVAPKVLVTPLRIAIAWADPLVERHAWLDEAWRAAHADLRGKIDAIEEGLRRTASPILDGSPNSALDDRAAACVAFVRNFWRPLLQLLQGPRVAARPSLHHWDPSWRTRWFVDDLGLDLQFESPEAMRWFEDADADDIPGTPAVLDLMMFPPRPISRGVYSSARSG